jgi:DNA-directed RNA polymerase specialized sigma24 family protein
MWQAVRRELAHLEWDAEPPLTQDLLSEWTKTVPILVAIRAALGPVPVDDPLSMLSTATTGAARTTGVELTVAPSLNDVRAALAGVARVMEVASDDDRRSHVATLNHVAYELAHWVRVRTTDDRAKAWLLAGETALDSAIHAPADRSAIGVGLAAWQDALAAVQPVQNAPIVRRSVALGHLAILRNAHALVREARQSGALPQPYSDALLSSIRELARVHQTTLSQIDGRRLGSTRIDQAVMLKLGSAVRQLTGRPDITEPSHIRLDALLRSSIGEAVLVANLTNQTSAKPVAGTISRLALEYLANPGMLRPADPRGSLPPGAPMDRTPAPVREPPALATLGEPSITPGTVLTGATVMALCRARDLGVAAATGDASNPPDILSGIDPSRWPQLVVEGRQAVTDLVASVIPMVYAQTRHALNAGDVRGQMFVELMGAAYRFDPQRIGPERWPTYAWMTLEHIRRRGVDHSGVIRSRSPRATTVTLGDTEPVSREPGPGAGIEARASIEAIKQALGRLPHSLQVPLLESMQGRPAHVIGEDFGVSESTARRRIQEARDSVRDELAPHVDDVAEVPDETVTDPVLERSQRLFEETFAPSLGPEPGRGRDR